MSVKKKKMESTKTVFPKSWGTTKLLAEVDWGTAVLRDSIALSPIDPREWGHKITVRNGSTATILKKKSLKNTQANVVVPAAFVK